MSANLYNPIWYNVERSIDSLILGSIGSNADVSLATDILLVFGSTFGLIGVLELELYVFSCLNWTWILRAFATGSGD